jgi:hypothetical protein
MTEAEKQTVLDALSEASLANTNYTGCIDARFSDLQDALETRWGMEAR